MSPWLRAGLVGAVTLAVLNLLGLIPLACMGLVSCGLVLVAYVPIGALAAHWMPPVREVGRAAGYGAIAAVLAALVGGIVYMMVAYLQVAAVDPAEVMSVIPPDMLSQLQEAWQEAGLDPQMLPEFVASPMGALLSGSMCCTGGLILGSILGAIGGATYASIRPED
jgi:hypothetical protein